MATKPKLIKVCLTNQGEDTETPWAHDLGAVPGGRKVKLVNVPFMHAKPTWGDTIVVAGTPLTWDRDGVSWAKLTTRILEDGGHWAMIVDYDPHPDEDAFTALAKACAHHDIVCEGAWPASKGKLGRAYFAVPEPLTDVDVMTKLRAAALPCELVQIHPAAPPKKKPVKKHAARRSSAKKKASPQRSRR